MAINAGIHGSLASCPVGGRIPAAHVQASQLGIEIEGRINGAAAKFRLVRTDGALTAANAECRTFSYTNVAGDYSDDYDVVLAPASLTTTTMIVCGVSVQDQEALEDNDAFWLQVEGIVHLTNGDSGTPSAGDLIGPANDADKGKVIDVNTTRTEALFRALEAAAADGTQFKAQIIRKLV